MNSIFTQTGSQKVPISQKNDPCRFQKLAKKNLDLIVANDVTREGAGFNTDTNIASLISHAGIRDYPLMSKKDLAGIILDSILEIRNGTQS